MLRNIQESDRANRGPHTTPGETPALDTNLPETNGGSCSKGRSGWVRAMKQAVPYLGRYLSKFVFEIIPGALVSGLAAYFLSILHLARGAEPTPAPPALASTQQSDGLSAD